MVNKIAIVGGEAVVQTPKTRNFLRRRDSWPPKLHQNLGEQAEREPSPTSPPMAAKENPIWHWSPAPFVPGSGSEAVPSMGEEENPHDLRHHTSAAQSALAWNDDQNGAQSYALGDPYQDLGSGGSMSLNALQSTLSGPHHSISADQSDSATYSNVSYHADPSEWSLQGVGYSDHSRNFAIASSGEGAVESALAQQYGTHTDEYCPPFTLVPSDAAPTAFQTPLPDAGAADYFLVDPVVPSAPHNHWEDPAAYSASQPPSDPYMYDAAQPPADPPGYAAAQPLPSPDAECSPHDAQPPGASEPAQRPGPGTAAGHAGALAEGKLAKLAKKQKDWVDHYCVLSCKPREGAAFGGIDFAYMLEFYASQELASAGHPAESIHAGHAAVKFVQGDEPALPRPPRRPFAVTL
jgi:hypothetical protein